VESLAKQRNRLKEHIATNERILRALERIAERLRAQRATAHVSLWEEVDANLRSNQRTIGGLRRGIEAARARIEGLQGPN
jgi:predicted RNase H-like nuclease (RuvC/YqgF family)